MHKSSARHIRVRMPDSDNFSLSGLLEELELEIEDREKSFGSEANRSTDGEVGE